MNDSLWFAIQRSRALQDFIQQLQWNDQASRDIHIRYLNPHQRDCEDMFRAFNDQYASLDVVNSKLKQAVAHMHYAYIMGAEVEKHHTYTVEEMSHARHEYEQGRRQENIARTQLPYIQKLIAQANEAGQ